MNKIEALQLQQDNHDKTYHVDIYLQAPIFKIKHFVLHYSKYLSKIILNQNVKKVILDTFLITLAFSNTLNIKLEDIDFNLHSQRIISNFNLITEYANSVLILSKALDAYDHIENHDIRKQLELACCNFYSLVLNYIAENCWNDFETDLLWQYQNIRNKRIS